MDEVHHTSQLLSLTWSMVSNYIIWIVPYLECLNGFVLMRADE